MKSKSKTLVTIFAFILIGLYLAAIILPRKLGSLDEIWIYNVARNVAQGKLLYVDISTIVTPLFPMLCSIFLKIFGNQMVVMRYLEIVLHLVIFITTFMIFKKLKVNTYVSIIFITICSFLYKEQLAIDYNFFVLAIVLIIVYLELKQNEKNVLEVNKKHEILVGLLAGLSICTKQTTGIIITLALLLYKIIIIKNKEELKQFAKGMLYKSIGIIIPIIIISIYFTANSMWSNFISYCITGIKEFTNKVLYNELLEKQMYIKLPAIIMPVVLIYMLFAYFRVRKKTTDYYSKLFTLAPFAIAESTIIYPISEEGHFYMGIYIALIAAVYILNVIAKNIFENKQKAIIYLRYFIELSSILFLLYLTISYTTPKLCEYFSNTYTSKLLHFSQIPIDKALEERIEEVSSFIKNQTKPVHILDAEGAIYTIPLDRYDKNYDMFLKGNLGGKGQLGQAEQITKEADSSIYLIKKPEYGRNWQSPEEVVKFVLDNFTKSGEINIYNIYERK